MTTDTTTYQTARGATLGVTIAGTVAPLLYAKNMLQEGKIPVLKDCFKGAALLAINVIPQTALALGMNSLINRRIFQKGEGEELSFKEKLVAAPFAGFISGAASTPCEFLVQNEQNRWRPRLRDVTRDVIRHEGVGVLGRGALALGGREAIYATGYLVISGEVSKRVRPYFSNSTVADIVGIVATAIPVGFMTTPPDVLRANKQSLLVKQSYPATLKKLGWRGMFKGVVPRTAAIALAYGVITFGGRQFDKHFQDQTRTP